MSTTEYFCEDSNIAVVNYSQLLGEGILVTYPTDGSEDEYRLGAIGETIFLAGLAEYEPEASLDKNLSRYDVYFTAKSNRYGSDSSSLNYSCGSNLYAVHRRVKLPDTVDTPSSFQITNEQGIVSINGVQAISEGTYVTSQENWEDKEFQVDWNPLFSASFFFSDTCSSEDYENYSENFAVIPNSFTVDEVVEDGVYYQVKAHRAGRTPTRRLARTKRPTEIRLADTDEIIQKQIQIPLKEGIERLKIVRYSTALYLYINNINTNTDALVRQINPFSSDSRNTYSVSCELLEECPKGTCQVDCGDVYCCYGADGIAVDSFKK